MLEEPKLAAHGMEEGAPLGVVRRTKLQGYGDVSLHVDGRKGIDHVSHGRRRSSGGGAVTSDINRLDLLGRGGRSPGKGAPGVVGKVGACRRQRQEVAARGGSPTCGLGLGQRKQREGGRTAG